jgi:hypothetical protein
MKLDKCKIGTLEKENKSRAATPWKKIADEVSGLEKGAERMEREERQDCKTE